MESNTPQLPDDEIDLLDLLVTVAENIKLLILGPLLAGALALGWASLGPQVYSSQFSIETARLVALQPSGSTGLNPAQITQLVSEPLARLVTASSTLAQAASILQEQGHSALASRVRQAVSAEVPRNSTVVRVSVSANTPEQAQTMAMALWQAVMAASKPSGIQAELLENNLAKDGAALTSAYQVEAALSRRIASGQVQDANTLQSYSQLLASIADLSGRVEELKLQQAGLVEANLPGTPSLPRTPVGRKSSLVAVVAALATGFALLLFVFVRQALRNAGANPESAAKLARIRRALGLKG